MTYRGIFDEYRCPKCGSYNIRKTGWLEFVCDDCGHGKTVVYEDIPHTDSFCTVVTSSGSDAITRYESDTEDEEES